MAKFGFSLAHSLTLGLAWAGVLTVSAEVVEPLIAFSIAAMAGHNLWTARKGTQPRAWLRLVFVFILGLVHGLGFGGALAGLANTSSNWLWTLFWANLGVEAAQLVALAAAAVLFRLLVRKDREMSASFALNAVLVMVGLGIMGWRL